MMEMLVSVAPAWFSLCPQASPPTAPMGLPVLNVASRKTLQE